MDLNLMQQLERAFRHTLKTALHIDARADAPMIRPPPATGRDLSASVDLRGEIDCSLTLRMSIETARCLTVMFVGADHDPMADEVCDVVGELASMVAGRLGVEADRSMQCGCPRVEIGVPADAEGSIGDKRLILPLSSDAGDLLLDLVMAEPTRVALPVGAHDVRAT